MRLRAAALILPMIAAPAHAADVTLYSQPPGALEKARERIAAGDAGVARALARLRREADQGLDAAPRSVMDKKLRAASGDPHDYYSLAPYWWPDPAQPGGRPYVRRDGETNPESHEGTDRNTLVAVSKTVQTLALAYHLTGHEPYGVQAARLIRAWLIDPATRMNPSLQYAQAIPGINDGRGIGIIEGTYLLAVLEAEPLVFASPAWTKDDEREYRLWLEAYLHWLRTSDNGRDEADEENNHGTWYDVQVAEIALLLGHRDEARASLEAALPARIARQIEPDGRQPLELARTKSLNYTLFNLEALERLAALGEHVGLTPWAIRTGDGRSIEKAVRFVAPYADPARPWIEEDIQAASRARILPIVAQAARRVESPDLGELLRRFEGADDPDARWRLFAETR